MWMLLAAGCQSGSDTEIELDPGFTDDTLVSAADVGASSGYEDLFFGTYQRGRAAIVLDYDGDGRLDEFSGNPGDTSYLLHNVSTGPGDFRFEAGQVIAADEDFLSYWGGAAADYDNDGDTDIFIAYGGNDTTGYDRLLRNDLKKDLSNVDAPFTELDDEVGIGFAGPDGTPMLIPTMGSLWIDLDLDGLLDLYTATEMLTTLVGSDPVSGLGREQLYSNRGDGTFLDIALQAGIDQQRSSRNPSTLDYDHDGDMDLFELNFTGGSILWHNDFVETGRLEFRDVTAQLSLGGGDLSYPQVASAFCSVSQDLNNDGWEDLVVFRRGQKDEPDEPEVHDIGHLLWLNVEGQGFVEVAGYTDLNDTFYFRDHNNGVMSCQSGDLDADGFPDLIIGNGSPTAGGSQQLYISTERTEVEIAGVGTVLVPQFQDVSWLIDIQSPGDTDYPYRHHGQAVADYDGDGFPELGAHNGGPMLLPPDVEMQEPNQLFVFDRVDDLHWLRVKLVGDGVAVNTDGIGAMVRVRVDREVEADLYQRRQSGSGFASQNDPVLFFGLAKSNRVDSVEVTWPDGTVQVVESPKVDAVLTVTHPPAGSRPPDQ
jgi:enediyne biosynthesis protein E4